MHRCPTNVGLHRELFELHLCQAAKNKKTCEFRHQSTRGQPAVSTGCKWGTGVTRSAQSKCHRPDNCQFKGNCSHTMVFYNRVPKTGSTSLWHAISDAANVSEAPNKFYWFGHRYRDNDKLNHRLMNEDHMNTKDKREFCRFVEELHTRANGALAFHTPYVDFEKMCPNFGLHPVYINMVRDPIDRLISGTKFTMSCVCRNQDPKANKNHLWCGRQIKEYAAAGIDACKTTVNDALAAKLRGDMATSVTATNVQQEADSCLYRKYFCGHSHLCYFAPIAERLARAKVMLNSVYAWVGILEAPYLSMQVLRQNVPLFKNIHELFHELHQGDLHKVSASGD